MASSALFNMRSKPFEGYPAPAPQDLASKRAYVEGLGYDVGLNDMVRTGSLGGHPVTTPLGQFRVPGPNAFDQAGYALGQDIDFLKSEVQQPYQEAIGRLPGIIESGAAGIEGAVERGAGSIEEILGGIDPGEAAQRISGAQALFDQPLDRLSAALDGVLAGAEERYGDTAAGVDKLLQQFGPELDAVIEQGLDFARSAVSSAQTAANGYDASANNTISAATSALDARVENQMRLIEAGVDPETGLPLSLAEQQAAKGRLMQETNAEIGRNVLVFKDEAQKFLAQLRMNVAQTELGAAGVTADLARTQVAGAQVELAGLETKERAGEFLTQAGLSAAEIEARAGLEGATQKANLILGSEQVRLGAQELSANVAQALANFLLSGQMAGTNLKLQGYENYAQLVASTPYVSMFEGLMAMFTMATAPGAQRVPAFDFASLGLG